MDFVGKRPDSVRSDAPSDKATGVRWLLTVRMSDGLISSIYMKKDSSIDGDFLYAEEYDGTKHWFNLTHIITFSEVKE